MAVSTLMVEFPKLQAILGEDLTQSLSALHSELEASSEALLADMLNVLNLRPGDPGFSQVKELLQKHHQSVSLKVNLPLIELEAAKEDLNRFLQERLCELGSGPQAQEALGEITQRLLGYNRRVTEIIHATPGVERPVVFNWIVLALAVEQPMEAVLLPGILDGLSVRLGMPVPGVVNPPASARGSLSMMGSHPSGGCHDDRGKGGQPGPDHSPCSAPCTSSGLCVRFPIMEGYRHCSHPHIPHIGGDHQQYVSPQEANNARRT